VATQQEIARVLAVLQACYPRQELPEPAQTVTVWTRLLGDLSGDEVAAAAERHARTSQWFPSVAEIREGVMTARVPALDAETAWEDVMLQVSRVGSRGRPTFSHPATDRAVRAIGWKRICLDEKPEMVRREFGRAFTDALAATRLEVQASDGLAAIGERT